MEKEVHYSIDGREYVGFSVSKTKEKRPVILVCHAFEGRNEVAEAHARYFADLGYVGFAVDLFGEKKVETTLDGCMNQITPFFDDLQGLNSRDALAKIFHHKERYLDRFHDIFTLSTEF